MSNQNIENSNGNFNTSVKKCFRTNKNVYNLIKIDFNFNKKPMIINDYQVF